MNEPHLRVRPKALTDFLIQRYAIQPGQTLCLPLGRPDASDHYRALYCWCLDKLAQYHRFVPDEQVCLIQKDLERLLVEFGGDAPVEPCEVSACTVAHLFETTPRLPRMFPARQLRRRTKRPTRDNVIPFKRSKNHE